MPVPRDQGQAVLQRQRCDPKVVIRNRRPCAFELNEQVGVLLGRLTARFQNLNRRFGQESLQQDLISMVLGASVETGFDLSQNDQRYPGLIACSWENAGSPQTVGSDTLIAWATTPS